MRLSRNAETQISVTHADIYTFRLPRDIASSIAACWGKNLSNNKLNETMNVEINDNTLRLVSTDTHILMIAEKPVDGTTGIVPGLYRKAFAPKNGQYSLMYMTHDAGNYVGYEKAVPAPNLLLKLGVYDGRRENGAFGYLDTTGRVCVDYRMYGRLVPTLYSIMWKQRYTYVFEGNYEDWKLRYLVMGMVPQEEMR